MQGCLKQTKVNQAFKFKNQIQLIRLISMTRQIQNQIVALAITSGKKIGDEIVNKTVQPNGYDKEQYNTYTRLICSDTI
jgi:hypothetical protein